MVVLRSEGLQFGLAASLPLSFVRPLRLPLQQNARSGWPRHRLSHCHKLLRIFAISSNDFRIGVNIEIDGAPWRIQEFLHVKPGKGAAFVRTKLRNYITGNTIDRTFRAGESVDEANVDKTLRQFTYKDGDQYVFMDMASYEESRLNAADVGDKSKWLKEGTECNVLTWNGRVIDVDLPTTIKLQVVETDPGLKGDTAQGGSKPATLDTGAVVNVPLFINIGELITIDTRTGTYLGRG